MHSADVSVIADHAPETPSAVIQHILARIAQEAAPALIGVFSYYRELDQYDLAAVYPDDTLAEHQIDFVWRALRPAWLSLEAAAVDPERLIGTGFRSGLAFPLTMSGELIGGLFVLSAQAQDFSPRDAERIAQWVPLAQIALENQRLNESLAASRAIQQAAQIIGENPSMQDFVNILHAFLCGPHVSLCAMMLYGPIQEDRPFGPFSYLEVRGTWLKRYGAGVGLGLRFYLDNYPNLVRDLTEQKVLTFTNLRQMSDPLDPLARAFLRAERGHSLTLIGLHTAHRQLGVIAIATDRPHRFSSHELHALHTVSEFLAISAMTQVLHQQHDLVQRGRAALLDAVRDGVMMVLPGPSSPHILTINECFTRMFNVPQNAAQGMSLATLMHRMQMPEDVRADLSSRWLSIPVRDPMTHQGEFNLVHPDGIAITIVWYSAPVYQNGQVMGRIFILHDVTAERAAANLRAHFVSRISHELRTPLTSIRGFAEFILEACGDELPDVAREYVEIIHSSAKHLNSVFSDIIEIVRADTGQMKLHIEPTHLPDVIIEVAALLEFQYKQRGQTVIMELDDHLPSVQMDTSRIKQVLANLVTNAIKYSPVGGKIRIVTAHIANRHDLPDSAPPDVVLPGVLIAVIDDGPGLSVEDSERVFLPFFRTREARASKVEGTGLGLTIARSIIELHRGKIWAEPRRRGRRGGRFLFTLPTTVA